MFNVGISAGDDSMSMSMGVDAIIAQSFEPDWKLEEMEMRPRPIICRAPFEIRNKNVGQNYVYASGENNNSPKSQDGTDDESQLFGWTVRVND